MRRGRVAGRERCGVYDGHLRVGLMAQTAREYCELIEDLESEADAWLERISRLLPLLHAAVMDLPPASSPAPALAASHPDDDSRFDLFQRLAGRLGSRDSYWLEFDTAQDEPGMTGSLADDFTDIYFDLTGGLCLFDAARPEQAAVLWRSSFQVHWGQHLVDAARQLYALRATNRLDTG